MAIAEMSKLNLVAMAYERDKILNALQATCSCEIKEHALVENTDNFSCSFDDKREYLLSTEGALSRLVYAVSDYEKSHKIKSGGQEELILTYSEFLSQADKKEEMDAAVAKIVAVEERSRALNARLAAAGRLKEASRIYGGIELAFSHFTSTPHAQVRLGTLTLQRYSELLSQIDDGDDLISVEKLSSDSAEAVVCAVFHNQYRGDELLSQFGFVKCPFVEGSGKSIYDGALAEESAAIKELAEQDGAMYALREYIAPLKIYCDYLRFVVEKAEQSEKLLVTDKTVLLEAFVPTEKQEEVASAIEAASGAVYYAFSKPAEDEFTPTYYKNNAVVKNFEAITDMYSPASYREFDPNTVMSVFYSLFLGFIMGDVGYGLIMLLGGGALYFKLRSKGGALASLSGVFAVGGIFAIFWGFLFNSLFGASFPYDPVIPDAQKDMWSVMGINIPAVLLIAMLLGVVQLMAGYMCRAYQCIRRGQILDAIFEGFTWAVFSLGVGLAIIGFIDEFNLPVLGTAGGIIAGVSLVIAMCTAGRKEKLVGKFTKGFGAAYGVISYCSDILSYARLYGLMLSGAVIAKIVTAYSVNPAIMDMEGTGFILSGNPALIILGVVLMLVGHIFNLAIGLLGAYIHDARLQYVEFYGRFFEGEGELFRPLGSTHSYVRLKK